MSGSIISYPTNGDADWSTFPDLQARHMRGHISISIDASNSTSAPTVQSGSSIEIGGSIYVFDADEDISTGWSAITTTTVAYLKVVPAGSTCTIEATGTVPAFSDAKQGYYNGNDRYFLEVYKFSATEYTEKQIIDWKPGCVVMRKIRLGEWDMSATSSISVDHGLSSYWSNIISSDAIVRNDAGTAYYHIYYSSNGTNVSGWMAIGTAASTIARHGTSVFKGSGVYDATAGTVANRGFLTIWYEA